MPTESNIHFVMRENIQKAVKKTNIQHPVLRLISKFMMPIIAVFAFYLQFHGDDGPGGGFQAGATLAVFATIYGLLYGFQRTVLVFPKKLLQIQAACGVLLYAGTGLVSLFAGKPFLDYTVFGDKTAKGFQLGQHIGIFLVELGVGFTVFSVISLLFFAFIEETFDARGYHYQKN